MIIRPETSADIPFIRSLTDAAFEGVQYSHQTEGAIVDALRKADALAISLIAEQDGVIIGHAAFSPVSINDKDLGWFGLGPVSVSPGLQGRGIGTALIEKGLALLEKYGAAGCVVLGNPNYYGRFGFTSHHDLHYGSVPQKYFQSLVLSSAVVEGEVTYHEGFEAQ